MERSTTSASGLESSSNMEHSPTVLIFRGTVVIDKYSFDPFNIKLFHGSWPMSAFPTRLEVRRCNKVKIIRECLFCLSECAFVCIWIIEKVEREYKILAAKYY